MTATAATATPSPAVGMWAPLHRPVFRAVWLAAFIANIGSWMQTVGAQWLLVERGSSSLLISLVQSASSLPVLLLVIPAGVVADFVDKRRLLVVVQGVQASITAVLALLTATGRMTPELILASPSCWGAGPRRSCRPTSRSSPTCCRARSSVRAPR